MSQEEQISEIKQSENPLATHAKFLDRLDQELKAKMTHLADAEARKEELLALIKRIRAQPITRQTMTSIIGHLEQALSELRLYHSEHAELLAAIMNTKARYNLALHRFFEQENKGAFLIDPETRQALLAELGNSKLVPNATTQDAALLRTMIMLEEEIVVLEGRRKELEEWPQWFGMQLDGPKVRLGHMIHGETITNQHTKESEYIKGFKTDFEDHPLLVRIHECASEKRLRNYPELKAYLLELYRSLAPKAQGEDYQWENLKGEQGMYNKGRLRIASKLRVEFGSPELADRFLALKKEVRLDIRRWVAFFGQEIRKMSDISYWKTTTLEPAAKELHSILTDHQADLAKAAKKAYGQFEKRVSPHIHLLERDAKKMKKVLGEYLHVIEVYWKKLAISIAPHLRGIKKLQGPIEVELNSEVEKRKKVGENMRSSLKYTSAWFQRVDRLLEREEIERENVYESAFGAHRIGDGVDYLEESNTFLDRQEEAINARMKDPDGMELANHLREAIKVLSQSEILQQQEVDHYKTGSGIEQQSTEEEPSSIGLNHDEEQRASVSELRTRVRQQPSDHDAHDETELRAA